MTTKRFLANDMSRALKKVREELGPDAIILSSKRADKGVEIIATLDDVSPSPEKLAKKQFAARFDEDLDQPLDSDTQWGDHHQAQRIAANTQVQASVSRSVPHEARFKPTAAKVTPQNQHIPSSRANDTQSIASEPFESAAIHAERLASEIQVAHERMLAARGQHFHDDADPSSSVSAQSVQGQNRQVAGFTQQVKARGLEETSDVPNDKLHSLYNEIAEMRMLLEEQMWHREQAPSALLGAKPLTGRAKQLAAQLRHLALPEPLTQALLECANDEERLPVCWRNALGMLARKLPIDTRDPIEQGGIFAFVGPTGVGKTTTVAKLAARYVLNHGRGKVAIVTTDTYRVGAHDQLKALGRILQVPVRSIEGEHQMEAVLASLKQYSLILIDTAGFRQGDTKQAQQEALLSACPELRRILVMACNSQAQILKASIHAYGVQPLLGCIMTKLDECASLGEAFGALSDGRVPLLYSAAGQEIPDDIQLASATNLVALAVKLARNDEGRKMAAGA
ncbi:flagellar biosynthesis protein FlhF [Marinagarivorans algicola]|uniref:flagellar biosynthesis protein FlhF n=1 Tax=Marinagarivorans algicola TaxID=1513270 RepID=UPI0006B580C9|nr:flagellar biosynthesis protein FlhF [Marinagarivorans algicola]